MKISLAWLQNYVERRTTADEVEPLLMNVGFPIDSRTPRPDGDEVLEVEVTSNRPDCLSHLGVAREVSAALGTKLLLPACELKNETGDAVETLTSVTLDSSGSEACPVYTARVIRGVKVGPSPAWLGRALEAVGLRSVNNVVDVTNYVLFEMGQPLHAFDLAKLNGRRIIVRSAREGEAFAAIDGTKHTLKAGMLVIADGQKPQAIAGVMGGLESEVTSGTTDILLESAIFAPLSVRRTSRALRLKSDSSYRFERGIDPRGVELASRRAVRLIVEVAGGTVARGVIRVGSAEPVPMTVTLRPARARALLGIELPTAEMIGALDRLGLSPKHDAARDMIACVIPSHRLDLKREIDLVEEVGRMAGYDRLPVGDRIQIMARPVQGEIAAGRRLRQVLTGQGYFETVTFSFLAPKHGEAFLPDGTEAVMVDDDRRKKEPMLRPSLLPSLLVCRKSNQDVGNADVRLFEVASTWSKQGGKITEVRRLALVADVGEGAEAAAQGLRELRGAILAMLAAVHPGEVTFTPVDAAICIGAAEIRLAGEVVGVCGLLKPEVQKLFELHGPVAAAELAYDKLVGQYPPVRTVQALPRFPAIDRDLSVIVDEAVTWQRIEAEVRAVGPKLMEELRYITTYRGKPIPAGKKSVSLRMVFRDPQTTLRHEQVDGQVAGVAEKLTGVLGAEIRR